MCWVVLGCIPDLLMMQHRTPAPEGHVLHVLLNLISPVNLMSNSSSMFCVSASPLACGCCVRLTSAAVTAAALSFACCHPSCSHSLPLHLQTLYLLAMQKMQTTDDVTGAVYNHDAIAKTHGQSIPYQGACNPACSANVIAGCPSGTGRCSLTAG
jgi:hypothetical protein